MCSYHISGQLPRRPAEITNGYLVRQKINCPVDHIPRRATGQYVSVEIFECERHVAKEAAPEVLDTEALSALNRHPAFRAHHLDPVACHHHQEARWKEEV